MATTSIEIAIPNDQCVNYLIGPKGSVIGLLQTKSGAQITVQRASEVAAGCTFRKVTISGFTEEACSLAATLVYARVEEYARSRVGGVSTAAKAALHAASTAEQLVIEIPNGPVVNFVIGQGGASIKSIQDCTGCHLEVERSHDVAPGCQVRKITISGVDEHWRAYAHQLVLARAAEYTQSRGAAAPPQQRSHAVSAVPSPPAHGAWPPPQPAAAPLHAAPPKAFSPPQPYPASLPPPPHQAVWSPPHPPHGTAHSSEHYPPQHPPPLPQPQPQPHYHHRHHGGPPPPPQPQAHPYAPASQAYHGGVSRHHGAPPPPHAYAPSPPQPYEHPAPHPHSSAAWPGRPQAQPLQSPQRPPFLPSPQPPHHIGPPPPQQLPPPPLSSYATPRDAGFTVIHIPNDGTVNFVIGPKGTRINSFQSEFGCRIHVQPAERRAPARRNGVCVGRTTL